MSDPMTTEREAFEAWVAEDDPDADLERALGGEGHYLSWLLEYQWHAWQAARRAQPSPKALTDDEITDVWERYDEGIGTRRDLVNRIAKRLGITQKDAG